MATQGFFIIDNLEPPYNGIIKDKDKNILGKSWQEEAPVGHFINGKLEGYWIITNEEYKQLKKYEQERKEIKEVCSDI
jgi:hypothetical protein